MIQEKGTVIDLQIQISEILWNFVKICALLEY